MESIIIVSYLMFHLSVDMDTTPLGLFILLLLVGQYYPFNSLCQRDTSYDHLYKKFGSLNCCLKSD